LHVLDDSRKLCRRWNTAPPAPSVRPIWLVRSAPNTQLEATPVLPSGCAASRGGQCSPHSAPLRWCTLSIERAVVLPSGLVVNGSHRFNLANSHRYLERAWSTSDHQLNGWCKHRMPPQQRLWSFRQLYASNSLHTLFQALPLLALALERVEGDENATVLAPSAMFKAVAQNVLPRARIMLSTTAVAAKSVHLVVGYPPFSPHEHHYARGCLARFRYLGPPLPPITAPGALVLFLTRGATAGARHGVREFGARQNQHLIAVTNLTVARHGHGARLEVFRFESLQQQHAAFRDASVVVGSEGTAFSGLAFCRVGVKLIQWALRRDEDWAVAEYLDLGADYYQLMPRWAIAHEIDDCNATRVMDDCPWHLMPEDVRLYAALLGDILRGHGPATESSNNAGTRSPTARTDRDGDEEAALYRVPWRRAFMHSTIVSPLTLRYSG